MRKLLLIWTTCSVLKIPLQAQSLQQSIQDAYLISRMVEKFHVQPRPLDDTLSLAIYTRVLEALDEQKIFFTAGDIRKLSVYQFRLDDEIRNRQGGFLELLTALYQQRLAQADTSPKFTDSLESLLRRKSALAVKRSIKRILQSPKGVGSMIGSIYCQVLASCYDPHTAYFQPETKMAFESRLGNKPLSFGLSLNEDEEGNTQIGRLKPGGPAFQSGGINEGDKIQSIQWDNKEPIDVSNAELTEIDGMLSTAGGNKITLTVKKADGLIRQVVLHKEKLDTDEDEDKVKGFILKGSKTIGYISLPAFYSDWENSSGVNGCANDVAKEIIKLKKENIEGLILDLRYNGGGSMQEAIELSGIFIDAGPVAQIKTREAKIITLKDVNRGTVYDGPLLILVNGLSASASEMVAGTLQDYNRALIAGSPTYGKATAQVILPMDTTINPDINNNGVVASSYIKLTTSKLYRITGQTAQVRGVQPDILLPEPADAWQEREADEKFAIPASTIEPNKYYKPLPALPLEAAQAAARITTGSDAPPFSVTNPAYEKLRIQSDAILKETNEERKRNVLNDPYIGVAYRAVCAMTAAR